MPDDRTPPPVPRSTPTTSTTGAARFHDEPDDVKVWILAHVKDVETGDWELGGVFTTRELAIAACVHPYDGIWEETLDRAYPRDETEYAPTFYPLRGIVGTGPGQPAPRPEENNHAD